MDTQRVVDAIHDDIRDKVLMHAPHVPSTTLLRVWTHSSAARHGQRVVEFGTDITGYEYARVEAL